MEILNLEGHPNCITGLKVTAILLNGWILSIGGATAVKGLRLQPAQQACFYPSTILGTKVKKALLIIFLNLAKTNQNIPSELYLAKKWCL